MVASLANPKVFFQRSLCCVDGGIVGGIHLAGSGILIPFEQLQREAAAAGVKVLTTHDDCGAYKLKHPDDHNPNQGAAEWGRKTADRLGFLHLHFKSVNMDRPAGFHDEVAVYYDGTGWFNRMPGMPKGFVVSRKYFSSAQKDLELCINIALGGHGFGDRFTAKAPFTVVVLPHPTDPILSAAVLRAEAEQIAAKFGGRVRVV